MPPSRTALALTTILATLIICACPKKEWHYAAPPAPAPAKDFDAQFDAAHLDPNGAAQNVDWHPQLAGQIPNPDACNQGQPYTSACTQNPIFQDQPDGIHQAFCFVGKATSGSPFQSFFGHADWMVAQFNGTIGWFNFGDDFDYDLFLIPGNVSATPSSPHGVTTNNNHVASNNSNPQYIEMEFDSDETDPAFSTGWWNSFKLDGHDNDPVVVPNLFRTNNQTLTCGSAVGLFGLDCDHGCRSELHPIYGLAIQRTEAPDDNEWSILARNWGTGGYCSQYNDQLAEQTISITLPYTSSQKPTAAEVSGFAVAAADSTAAVGCPALYFQNGQTVVNLTLPPPEQQAVAAFSLKLQWPDGAQPIACTQPHPAPAEMALAPQPAPHPLDGEGYMGALLQAAAQNQNPSLKRPTLEKDILPIAPKSQTKMQSLKRMALAPQAHPCDGLISINSGPPPTNSLPTIHRMKKDPHKQIRDDAVRTYICHSYRTKNFTLPPGTSQQDFDHACKGVK